MAAKEEKEKIKSARETMGKYFYDLSKLIFTSTVLTNGATIFGLTNYTWQSICVFCIGIIGTWATASIGNKILRR